jgi:subtilase family serine protease
MKLRVYLAGQRGMAAAALAVSSPQGPDYGHYLSATQFRRRYGATSAQIATVKGWLTAEGMTVTATSPHYVTVTVTPAELDAAFGTKVIQYDFPPIIKGGHKFPSQPAIGTAGEFSVPAALGGDIAAVTGLQFVSLPAAKATAPQPTRASAPKASTATAAGYHCSQYWAQHTERIPAAFGEDSAPTSPCGWRRRSTWRACTSPRLTTLGEDQPPLRATKGYDDETGLGTPGPSFVPAFGRSRY